MVLEDDCLSHCRVAIKAYLPPLSTTRNCSPLRVPRSSRSRRYSVHDGLGWCGGLARTLFSGRVPGNENPYSCDYGSTGCSVSYLFVPGVKERKCTAEMRRHDTYCSNFTCTPATVGFRSGARRAMGLPSNRSRSMTNSAVPSVRPLLSASRRSPKPWSSVVVSNSAKCGMRSSTGRTVTSPSSAPFICALALDQGQSSARVTRRARTGFRLT
jgi:hypothetical protein